MTTPEGFHYQAPLKRLFSYIGENPELFLKFISNLRNAVGGYKKILL